MNLKQKKYSRLEDQLSGLLKNSPSFISQLSTINAVLFNKMQNFFWIGFYLLKDDNLTVGPYQGALACQTLKKPNGVCWASILKKEPIIVSDVHTFPGHIACDSRSKSEIVFPLIRKDGTCIGTLDIDSDKYNQFDTDDLEGLKRIVDLIDLEPK